MDEAIEKVNSMTTKTEVANAQYGFLVERVKTWKMPKRTRARCTRS